MKKITVEMYKTDDGKIRFVRAQEGGWITLVDADGIDVTTGGFFSTQTTRLSDFPGLDKQIVKGLVELTEYMRDNK